MSAFKRRNLCILGVDPGLEGAMAIISIEHDPYVFDLPTIGTGTKRCLNEHGILERLGGFSIDHAYVEYVSAMPGWGSGGSFRFGMSFGTLRTIVALRGIPYTLVTPVKWKKHFNLSGKDKEGDRQMAIRLYPAHAEKFSRKKDHQRADAILLATYGLQIHNRIDSSSSGNHDRRPRLISSVPTQGD